MPFNATQRKILLEKFAINNHPQTEEMADIAEAIGEQVSRVRVDIGNFSSCFFYYEKAEEVKN